MHEQSLRERLATIRCFLLDMDGTFYLGNRLIEGSIEFLEALRATGRDAWFLTNNSSKSASVYVEKLTRMGVPEPFRSQVMTSGHAAARYIRENFPAGKGYLLGNAMLREELTGLGLTFTEVERSETGVINASIDDAKPLAGRRVRQGPNTEEHPDYVLVAYDTTLDYAKMCAVCDHIRAGLPYIATHPDFNCPTETGFIPDMGAIMAFIEASTGRKADIILGKPYGGIVREAVLRTGYQPQECAMVGDRLYTDVRTGVDHGMTGILVLSGEATMEDVAVSDVQPHLIFGKLADMIPYL